MNAIEILRAASRSVPNEDYVQFMAAVDAVALLVEKAKSLQSTLNEHGDWDDGCFYYAGTSASELELPITSLYAALARVGGT